MGKNKTPGTKRDATDGVRQKRGGGKREKRQQDAVIPKSVLIADGVIDVKKTKNRSRTAKKQRQAQKATSDDIIKKMEAELSSDEEVEKEIKEESKEEEVVVEAVVSAGKTKLGLMEDDDDEEEMMNQNSVPILRTKLMLMLLKICWAKSSCRMTMLTTIN